MAAFIVAAVFTQGAFERRMMAESADGTTASGTLNIVLANPHGFVIATDSRMTFDNPQYPPSDSSQKLFRTSNNSALAIAGYATGLAGTPYEFEIAAAMRSRFGDKGLDDGRGSPFMVESWVEGLGLYLTRISLILSEVFHKPTSPFQTTIAGFDKTRVPEIRFVQFNPVMREYGANGDSFPVFEKEDSLSMRADHLVYKTAGINVVAERILEGNYSGRDRDLLRYIKYKRHNKQKKLDDLSLDEMKNIVLALFNETEHTPIMIRNEDWSSKVGGLTQIATFARDGKVTWRQQSFEPRRSLLLRTALTMGAVFSSNRDESRPGKLVEMEDHFAESLSTGFHQIFAGDEFHSVRVSLDANLFLRNRFQNCTFVYKNKPFDIVNATIEGTCAIEVANGLPAELTALSHRCTVIRLSP